MAVEAHTILSQMPKTFYITHIIIGQEIVRLVISRSVQLLLVFGIHKKAQ